MRQLVRPFSMCFHNKLSTTVTLSAYGYHQFALSSNPVKNSTKCNETQRLASYDNNNSPFRRVPTDADDKLLVISKAGGPNGKKLCMRSFPAGSLFSSLPRMARKKKIKTTVLRLVQKGVTGSERAISQSQLSRGFKIPVLRCFRERIVFDPLTLKIYKTNHYKRFFSSNFSSVSLMLNPQSRPLSASKCFYTSSGRNSFLITFESERVHEKLR